MMHLGRFSNRVSQWARKRTGALVGVVTVLATILVAGGIALQASTPPEMAPSVPQPGGLPWCGTAYRRVAAGLGVDSVFRADEAVREPQILAKPRMQDEGCYRIGQRIARSMKVMYAPNTCRSDYARGRHDGFQNSIPSIGSDCYVWGYEAGFSQLTRGSLEFRTDWVSAECVAQNKLGRHDAAHAYALRPPRDAQLQQCYTAGYDIESLLWESVPIRGE